MPNRNSPDYDSVIVGAGPAGAMAAMKAAQRGPVLLVEASSLPRDKSCGGMLNEYAQEFLGEFAQVPEHIVLGPKHVNFRFWDWDRQVKKPTDLRFLNIDRRGFDDWLLSLLPDNVDIVGGTSVTDFKDVNGCVTVALKNGGMDEVCCNNLVGCDGARSQVRRTMGAGSVANYVTLQDFVRLEGELEPFFDCIYMRDIGDSYAYSYIVPKGDEAIVGSVYYPRTKRPHEKQDQTMGILRASLPQLGETIRREASVALYVRDSNDVVPASGRVLLAGEAGGFMSPTSGEGISYAMNSGLLAGTAIAENDPLGAAEAYERASAHIASNIRRKLKWLPFMESDWGKYLAGYVPQSIISRITTGL